MAGVSFSPPSSGAAVTHQDNHQAQRGHSEPKVNLLIGLVSVCSVPGDIHAEGLVTSLLLGGGGREVIGTCP